MKKRLKGTVMFPSGLHSDPEMVRVRDGRNHVDQPFSFLAELTVG
ncbi:hypothetical protein B4073_1665 [Bacillus subtilis]|uniref:Uncharacterized protein n=2 Tax=Bacillus subtilis TaxID=1423 RepID=A0A0C3HQH9_BACIU|nr:hypothetical protein I33_1729 [Bacillus subtilis subsp. subtilis str. RO-NN-1]EHA29635.1 hypothetical protein BSSC8_27320 [Bacillus subtilis subsp. subtilis str. SC-8]KIL29683.1 hypothetical protein B4067_1751 [Bacillus subtilis subsp. subtilis]KIN33431.1 hypothetical protein B4069_1601 [Bacillus subtilis]GAK80520.1 hypothetical protein BSMD_024320 [Bacillus subtilis Miyagi-4]